MLYMLDLRLQEITQKDIPFGGIGVICFGDLMQLTPIQGKFIFEEPKNTADFSEAHLLDPTIKKIEYSGTQHIQNEYSTTQLIQIPQIRMVVSEGNKLFWKRSTPSEPTETTSRREALSFR